jgi:hypothetical protein
MRLAMTLAFSMMTLLAALGMESDCGQGVFSVRVVDCKGSPVQGANVQIQLCCGGNQQSSASTDQGGLAQFQNDAKDICVSKVVIAGQSTTSFNAGSCKGDGKVSCVVQICGK